MPETDEQFTITRDFAAPRERLWRAWTDPDEAPHWFHPSGLTTPRATVDYDLRVVGTYRYTMVEADGTEYPTGGRYREIEEPERLVFTWGDPDDPDDSLPVITVTLAEHDGGTRMTFHLIGAPGKPGDESFYDGWVSAHDELAAYVEG